MASRSFSRGFWGRCCRNGECVNEEWGMRKRSFTVVDVALVVVLLTVAARAENATFYVTFGGDDAAEGSEAAPFKTIARAQEAVRQHLKERKEKGDVSVVISGRHFLSEPLVFTPDDTAKDDSIVTYKSHESDRAVLSGGRAIGGWKQNGQLWQTVIPEATSGGWRFRELFVGGQRRPRARTPTEGYFRVVKAGPDNRTSFFYKPGDLRRWSKLHAAELVFLHDWSISRVGIANIDEASRSVHLASSVGPPSPHFAMTNFEPHPRYAIENAPELLDSPGEWYLDAESGVLTYWPVAIEDISKVEVIAPVATGLITVRGDESNARAVRNLRFEGLTLSHCAWQLPPGGYAESQATNHAERHGDPNSPSAFIPAAVMFDGAENCALERCRLEHLGGSGIWFRRACRNNRVAHSVIRDVAANGANVGEAQVHVPSAEAIAAGTALSPVSQGNAITHCRISRCGALYYGAVGVWVGMAKATEISANEIRNLPYTGVSVGWNWSPATTVCEGHLIASNHIHHVDAATVGRRRHLHARPPAGDGAAGQHHSRRAGQQRSRGEQRDVHRRGEHGTADREQRDLQHCAKPDSIPSGRQEHAAEQSARGAAKDAAVSLQQHS